jgi:hypothetical protein
MLLYINIFTKMTKVDDRGTTVGRSTYRQDLVIPATSVCSVLSGHRVSIISRSIITILLYREIYLNEPFAFNTG